MTGIITVFAIAFLSGLILIALDVIFERAETEVETVVVAVPRGATKTIERVTPDLRTYEQKMADQERFDTLGLPKKSQNR